MARPSHSTVIAYAALFTALGGSAYAVTADRNSVRSSSIKDGQVRSQDLGDGAVTASKIGEGVSVTGPQGPQGPQGPAGKNGTNGTNGTAPAGGVMFFNLASCPAGWTELTTARGRYLVARPAGGTLAGTAGTPLTNLENRPVGQHNHPITDPGHTHKVPISWGYNDLGFDGPGGTQDAASYFAAVTYSYDTESRVTGITVNNAGTVAGTNAPYIQLLACQKT